MELFWGLGRVRIEELMEGRLWSVEEANVTPAIPAGDIWQ